jgi:PAS domain S-box-containing protein
VKANPPPISAATRLGTIIMAGFGLTLLSILVVALVAYWNLHSHDNIRDNTAHVHSVIDHLEALRSWINDAETRERDFLITGDQYNLELYQAARTKTDQEAHLLDSLTRDDEDQRQRMKALTPLIDARLSSLEDSVEVRNQMGPQSALDMIRSSSRRSLMDDVLRRVNDMIDEERLRLPMHSLEDSFTVQPVFHIIVGGCLAALALLSATLFYLFQALTEIRASLKDSSQRDIDSQTQSRFMHAVLEDIDEGVVVLDRDMKVVQSNPVATRLLGASRSQTVEEFRAEFEPSSGGDGLTLALEHLQTKPPSAPTDPSKTELVTPDEPARISLKASARVLRDKAGGLRGGVLFLRDVTAHKRMERQLKANETSLINLFHYSVEAGFVVTLEDSLCIGVNEGFLRLCGYSREEILGQTVDGFGFCDNAAELKGALELGRSGQVVCDRTMRFRAKSGRRFEAVVSIVPVEIDGEACIVFAVRQYATPLKAAAPSSTPSNRVRSVS